MAETLVKPSTIIKSQVIDLPPGDQFTLRVYVPLYLCFRLDPEVDRKKVSWELRCGLSDALTEYPPFAGYVVEYDTARSRIQMKVSVDDGVPFKFNDLTASGTQPSLLDFDTLEQAHFPPSQFDSSLDPVKRFFPLGLKNKALLIQANFIKGGLLLAVAAHHSASDAQGLNGFLRTWAKHTAAASKGLIAIPQPSLEILDRSPLFQFSDVTALEKFERLVKVDDPTELTRWLDLMYNTLPANRGTSNLKNVYWYFSPERLKALKAAAQPIDQASSWISTNDALCAFLWRHVTIARQLKDTVYEKTALQIPCSVRGRLSPQVNGDYFGNAIVHAHLSYPIKELCSTTVGRLAEIASDVRKAISELDSPMIRAFYGIIDSLPTTHSARYNFQAETDIYVTNSANNDFDKADWGKNMGRMCRQRNGFHSMLSGVMIQTKFAEGGVEVFMTPDADVLDRLRHDETFTTFAEFRCC